MSNIYYNPQDFGLTIVGEVEFSSGCYEFDTSVLWRSDAGEFYIGDDSGCSCPSPFEDIGIRDLMKIAKLQDLIDYFAERCKESFYYDSTDEFRSEDSKRIDGEIGQLISTYQGMTA
jgi:hypothetical protein